jgi:predicted aspartyl protease
MRLVLLVLLVVLASASLQPTLADDDQKCALKRVSALDMDIDPAGGITVPVDIGAHHLRMLVDTGGLLTALSPEAAASLGVYIQGIPISPIRMFNGDLITHYAEVDDIGIGNLRAKRMVFLVFPPGHLPNGVDGTLGPDILRAYDTEFDFAGAKFNLYLKDHCEGRVVYWTHDPHAEIPLSIDEGGHIIIPVTLDGKSVQANVDTGASRSTMELEEAKDMFGDQLGSALKRTQNDPNEFTYPFKSLTLVDLNVNNPDIVLISRDKAKQFYIGTEKMILGMGILRQLHLYIAYHEKMLYATPASAH